MRVTVLPAELFDSDFFVTNMQHTHKPHSHRTLTHTRTHAPSPKNPDADEAENAERRRQAVKIIILADFRIVLRCERVDTRYASRLMFIMCIYIDAAALITRPAHNFNFALSD